MKRIFALAFAFVLLLAGCTGQEKTREAVFKLAEENYDAICKACREKDTNALSAIEGIGQIKVVDGYVLVYCGGAGIAPSSQDYGFYYSAENSPVAVDCNMDIIADAHELTPEGNGFRYTAAGNTFYTEPIKGNLYFYSNAY